MRLRTYILIVGALILTIGYLLYTEARSSRPSAEESVLDGTPYSIFVSVVWPKNGLPPIVHKLVQKARYPSRVRIGLIGPQKPSAAAANLRHLEMRRFGGYARGRSDIERTLMRDDTFYMTLESDTDVVVGWDARLIHAWAECGSDKAILTSKLVQTQRPTFLAATRVGKAGLRTEPREFVNLPDGPVPQLYFASSFSFGLAARVELTSSLFAPSLTTTDTMHAIVLHRNGYVFRAPHVTFAHQTSLVEPVKSTEHWTTAHGLAEADAESYRAFVGISDSLEMSVRAKLGIVDPFDERECSSKYGTSRTVREALTAAFKLPHIRVVRS